MASGRAADREDPKKSKRRAARSLDRDPISELHQGQRSNAPHQRAGHMTAPDHFAEAEFNILRRRGPSTYDFCHTAASRRFPPFARTRSIGSNREGFRTPALYRVDRSRGRHPKPLPKAGVRVSQGRRLPAVGVGTLRAKATFDSRSRPILLRTASAAIMVLSLRTENTNRRHAAL
jgi:hypothetical protein